MARPRAVIRGEGLWRFLMLEWFSRFVPMIMLTEFPKSGGTWLGLMLSECMDIPFPRHEFPSLRSCIMHGHYIRQYKYPKKIILWRDPRDIMVSWYHHCVFVSERTHPAFVEQVRQDLRFEDYEDVRGNLPEFIRYCFTRQRSPRFSWNAFFDAWHGREDCVHTSYEILRIHPVDELMRISEVLGAPSSSEDVERVVERLSFRKMAGRNPGEEKMNTFLRKGIVGDWKNQFSHEAAEVLADYVGDRLIRAGYESESPSGWSELLGSQD